MERKFKIIGGTVLVIAALYFIKIKVHAAPDDSLVGKWLANHPNSRDNITGAGKAPILIYLLSKKS